LGCEATMDRSALVATVTGPELAVLLATGSGVGDDTVAEFITGLVMLAATFTPIVTDDDPIGNAAA
jgi:hypothetical protein